MRRGALLLWLGFLIAALIGNGTEWALARYTTLAALPGFLIGICAGFASLIVYAASVTKIGM